MTPPRSAGGDDRAARAGPATARPAPPPTRNPRALGAPDVADIPPNHRRAGAHRARSRLQHAARPGARTRRRVLQRRPRAARRRSRSGSRRHSIRSRRSSTAAHAAGLRVHAWVNVNLVSSAADLPIAREHLVHRHPEWLMVPRDIAQELAQGARRQPGLRRQARALDARAAGDVEGLYASPIVPGAADAHRRRRARPDDAATRSTACISTTRAIRTSASTTAAPRSREFRAAIRPSPRRPTRRKRSTRAKPSTCFAYPDALPDEWRELPRRPA